MPTADQHGLAVRVRDALCSGDGMVAYRMASELASREDCLPELFLFLGELGATQAAALMRKAGIGTCPDAAPRYAQTLSRIGRLGFCFPQWRYLARSFEHANRRTTLFEQWGMRRLHRPDDGRMGPAFVLRRHGFRLEMRRSYLAVSGQGMGSLVVRNSSHYWGRNLLPYTAAYSAHVPIYTMERGVMHAPGILSLERSGCISPECMDGMNALLEHISAWEASFARWLGGKDAACCMDSLRAGMTHADAPWMTEVDANAPPWFPLRAMLLTNSQEEVTTLARGAVARGNLPCLLSSSAGDLPA